MTTENLALVILAAILAQVAVAALIWFYRRGRQYRISTPSATGRVEPHGSALGWDGFKEFIVQRRVIEDVNSSVCSFYLAPLDGKQLPTFRPGQFLTFKLLISDPVTQQPKTVVRCYSLSEAPRPDCYRISIKKATAPVDQADAPPGLSSNFFHDHIQEDSRLLVKAPSGHFHLMEDEPLPIVLIGGGIGITPMLSTLNTVLDRGLNREIWLFYGVRNSDEQIMKEHLQTLASAHDNFHLHICYSAPNKSDVIKVDYQHRGRVDIPLLRATLKLMRYQFYVCGPKAMMESLVPGLEEWGVDSADIYYESFGPATLIKHEKVTLETGTTQPVITFSRSGKSISWDPTFDSLLDFAEDNNIEVEAGCRAGSCGSCQTAVKAGEVDYIQEPDADVESGHCLLCISMPKGDLTLDT